MSLKKPGHMGGNSLLTMACLSIGYALLFSPTHLSVFSISQVMGWGEKWAFSPIANAGIVDFVVILFVKLHLIIGILFFFGLLYGCSRFKELKYRFLVLSFAVPFLVLSVIKWKLAWYLMFLLPFTYIMAADSVTILSGYIKRRHFQIGFLLICCSFFLVLEVEALKKTHPYYQLDGFQHGAKYVGWDKPAFLTTEKVRDVAQFIRTEVNQSESVGLFFIDYGLFNDYVLANLKYELGDNGFDITVAKKENLERTDYDYLVLHFYSREYLQKAKNCNRIETFSNGNLEIFYILECKNE